jgi:thiol:disulfide interchange protein DsbD
MDASIQHRYNRRINLDRNFCFAHTVTTMAIRRSILLLIGFSVLTFLSLLAGDANAQLSKFGKSTKGSGLSRSLGGASPFSSADVNNPVAVKAEFKVHPESRTGLIQVTAQIADGWHINSVTQTGGPIATKISLGKTTAATLAGNFEPDQKPHEVDDGVLDVPRQEHTGTVTWTAPLRFSKGSSPKDLSIPVAFFYQACEKSCLPPKTVNVTAKYGGELQQPPAIKAMESAAGKAMAAEKRAAEKVVTAKIIEPRDSPEDIAQMAKLYDAKAKINYVPLHEKGETTLLTALFGAFVGGFLLNLMPCVFPVLGIKVMGFVQQAGSDPKKIRLHGLAFTAGLVVSMWALAGFILFVKLSLGQNVNWGQQMGSPYFVVGIIVLLFLMGLNMAGVFEFGTSMTRLGGTVQNKKGYGASFLSGVLTTLIATPCSGPFLGAAMGYTLAQPPAVAMLLFTVLALGIALPYLVLSMSPSLINALPKPGAWMETFKVTMAFLIFAAVAWFMKTFGGQTGVEGLSWLLMALVVIGMAAYFYGHWTQLHFAAKTRYLWGMTLPLLIAMVGGWMALSAAGNANYSVDHGEFRAWTPGIVEYQTSQENRAVLVDYTAEWCPTCQVNEKRVFSNEFVKSKLAELGVVLVAADMTDMDEAEDVVADLARADRFTISTYLVYPANYPEEPAILLEELISPNDVLQALDRIAPQQETDQANGQSQANETKLR